MDIKQELDHYEVSNTIEFVTVKVESPSVAAVDVKASTLHDISVELEDTLAIKTEEINIKEETLPTASDADDLHSQLATTENSFACNLADKSRRKELIPCNVCKYKTFKNSTLKRHMLVHTGEKPFQCITCSYKTSDKWTLKGHLRLHTGVASFTCSLCEYKTSKIGNLKRHILNHTRDKTFAYNIDKYKTSDEITSEDDVDNKPLVCSICSYWTRQEASLRRHLVVHTGEIYFDCNLCNYKTFQKSHLKRHMLVHTGEKPFQCNICSYKTSEKSTLKGHLAVHSGEAPFACSLCEYRTSKSGNLKRHIKSH